jgi:2,4-dienoyl-CoA reductase-like NADH-dependent reductase (Old Yellow Enzyme family)
MSTASLFTPVSLGALRLPNRIIMSSLTRCRADAEHIPTALMAEYYAQRASAGHQPVATSDIEHLFVASPWFVLNSS